MVIQELQEARFEEHSTRLRLAKVAIHFIGGDMVEAKGGLVLEVQTVPVGAGDLSQRVGADDAGLDEGGGAVVGAVDGPSAARCVTASGRCSWKTRSSPD